MGRKLLLFSAAIGYAVLSVPAIRLLGMENLVLQFLGLGFLSFLLVILVSSESSTLPALFPTTVNMLRTFGVMFSRGWTKEPLANKRLRLRLICSSGRLLGGSYGSGWDGDWNELRN